MCYNVSRGGNGPYGFYIAFLKGKIMIIRKKALMKDYTSFKIGGPADVLVEPKDIKELVELIKFLRKQGIIYYIIGNGTNILVSDKGVRGCVVRIGKNLSKIKVNGNKIEAEAGASLAEIAQVALKNGLQGFEELSGIPGTIGGALAMNAGAYEKEIRDVFSSANAINEDGRVVKLSKDAMNFSYRKSAVSDGKFIVTQVIINLQEGDKKEIQKNMERYRELRRKVQPIDMPSAGSTFKRPENGYASRLIDQCHLKGEKIGGAEVSNLHAGFIVNVGNAKAMDVYKLAEKVKSDVKAYFNTDLELEVKLWGKFK